VRRKRTTIKEGTRTRAVTALRNNSKNYGSMAEIEWRGQKEKNLLGETDPGDAWKSQRTKNGRSKVTKRYKGTCAQKFIPALTLSGEIGKKKISKYDRGGAKSSGTLTDHQPWEME